MGIQRGVTRSLFVSSLSRQILVDPFVRPMTVCRMSSVGVCQSGGWQWYDDWLLLAALAGWQHCRHWQAGSWQGVRYCLHWAVSPSPTIITLLISQNSSNIFFWFCRKFFWFNWFKNSNCQVKTTPTPHSPPPHCECCTPTPSSRWCLPPPPTLPRPPLTSGDC